VVLRLISRERNKLAKAKDDAAGYKSCSMCGSLRKEVLRFWNFIKLRVLVNVVPRTNNSNFYEIPEPRTSNAHSNAHYNIFYILLLSLAFTISTFYSPVRHNMKLLAVAKQAKLSVVFAVVGTFEQVAIRL